MRILVTVKPRMYRETLALALHKRRPDAEVMLVPPDSLDGQVTEFAPDMLVRNDNDGLPPEYLNTIPCRVEILFTDSLGARINLSGQIRQINDMSVDDLIAIVDEVELLVSGRLVD